MVTPIRETIANIQKEILKGDLFPQRAAEILTELSALYGNILDQVSRKQVEYNRYLLACLDEEKRANRAKIKAQVSPTYEALQEATNTLELAQEIIRSLKYFLRQKEEEYKHS